MLSGIRKGGAAVRILSAVAGDREAGRAVRAAVPRLFSLGTHEFRRLKQQGGILVNGEIVHADRILQAGDRIEVRLKSEGNAGAENALPPETRGCRIVYLDGDLIAVSKAAPLPTLPGARRGGDSLREIVRDMLGAEEASFGYHPVNRLDKGTSGLLIVARHAHAQRLLSAGLHTDNFVREYLAVTEGVPREAEGVIDAPIARAGAGARRCVRADGQRALTRYRIESVSGSRALVRLRLFTGRTHQIRVHLAHLGCPVVGDYLYGREHPELSDRFALHSAYLSLVHPITGARLSFSDPPPGIFGALLRGG